MAWNTTGCTVTTAKDSASSVLFAKDGYVTVRQIELVTTTEIRGLNANTAQGYVTAPTYSLGYAETTYYKTIDGSQYTFVGTSGTMTKWAARRVDESDQWVATKTETTYSLNVNPATSAGGSWGTSSSGSTTTNEGVEVPVSSDRTATYQWEYGGDVIASIVSSTVTEYRNVTAAGKATYEAQASASATMQTHTHGLGYSVFNHGTDVLVSSRYVSAEEGWTVTKTVKKYDWTGANWTGPTHLT